MAGQATTRQSAPVTVTRNARRYGSYPGGYQIINTSLVATIWVADNPSVAPGQGTPIYPGTAVTWATDGELFMALGNDAQSATALSADVILSYDVEGWQPNPIAVATQILNSGVIVVDNPLVLFSTGLPVQTARIDVSRFNSLQCSLEPITIGGPYTITFNWYPDAVSNILIAQDTLAWYDYNAGVNRWQGVIPCRSAYLRINTTGGAGNIFASIIASYRQVDTIRQTMPYQAFPYLAFNRQVLAIGVQSAPIYIPPWFGLVDIYTYNNQNDGNFILRGLADNPGNDDIIWQSPAAINNEIWTVTGVGIWGKHTVPMQGRQLVFILWNNSAIGASDMRVAVYPHRNTI